MTSSDESRDECASVDRRAFVGAAGAVGALAVAGCLNSGTDENGTNDGTENGEQTDERTNGDETRNGDGEEQNGDDDADETADSVAAYEGVTYAERDAGEMKLDLFVPEIDAPPLLVYVHGGGWVWETRDNVPEPERYAAEMGYAIASVSYRLAPSDSAADDNPTPRGVFPNQIVDVKASIRWLRANADEYGYDADQVAVWGASAGGHLASLAGVVDDVTEIAGDAYPDAAVEKQVAPDESGAVQAVVDWYGIHDLLELSGGPGSMEAALIGGAIPENEAKAERASPTTYVSSDCPPFLVMHGRADGTVSIDQSRVLVDALNDANVDTAFYELHDLGHAWGANSERTAMDVLTADPRPDQTIVETVHAENGSSASGLLDGKPPAGPDAIEQFLDRALD